MKSALLFSNSMSFPLSFSCLPRSRDCYFETRLTWVTRRASISSAAGVCRLCWGVRLKRWRSCRTLWPRGLKTPGFACAIYRWVGGVLDRRDGLDLMHGRSRTALNPRIRTMPGRSISGFHRSGRHCLHQARSAGRRPASRMKGELLPTKNRL